MFPGFLVHPVLLRYIMYFCLSLNIHSWYDRYYNTKLRNVSRISTINNYKF